MNRINNVIAYSYCCDAAQRIDIQTNKKNFKVVNSKLKVSHNLRQVFVIVRVIKSFDKI